MINNNRDLTKLGLSPADFAFGVATNLAGLYMDWNTNKKNQAQMKRLISLNLKEIKLLNDLKTFGEWQKTIGLLSEDLLNIQSQYNNLTVSYTDLYYKEFIRSKTIAEELSTALTKIRDVCVNGFTGNQSDALHTAFLKYIRSINIDQSDRFAVSVFKYYIASLYYQAALLKFILFKHERTPQREIDEWIAVIEKQLLDIKTAFDKSIKVASPKYKTLENVKSPFKLYSIHHSFDQNDGSDEYTVGVQKIALGQKLIAPKGHVIIGVKFNKTDVSVDVFDSSLEEKGNLGLEITTTKFSDLMNINSEGAPENLPTQTVSHEDYTYSKDTDFALGRSTSSFVDTFNRLTDKHVLTGIKLVQHKGTLFNALGLELYSQEILIDKESLDPNTKTSSQTATISNITTFDSLPDEESKPALADSRRIEPHMPSVITGVCIIKRDHCIQLKLETQDWRSLNYNDES